MTEDFDRQLRKNIRVAEIVKSQLEQIPKDEERSVYRIVGRAFLQETTVSEQTLRRMFDVNHNGTFFLCFHELSAVYGQHLQAFFIPFFLSKTAYKYMSKCLANSCPSNPGSPWLSGKILGDHLYIPPLDASLHPLPSPNKLKNKFLLRGKTLQTINSTSPRNSKKISKNLEEKEENSKNNGGSSLPLPIDPTFGKLIALQSFKISPSNIYMDKRDHPSNASPSLSERKVQAFLDSNVPFYCSTSTRIGKSFPSGIRQDSSNIDPMESWICGIQLAAMNFQTCDEELDLNKGLFSINGSIGYILKPKILLEGRDPRHKMTICCTLEIPIIFGQYLPKAEPGKSGIVDPYVIVEIFRIPNDRFLIQFGTKMSFPLRCPELAILRICVKDFDSTSADEFIGEFSVPVQSIRQGYSHVRLNTGSQHLTGRSVILIAKRYCSTSTKAKDSTKDPEDFKIKLLEKDMSLLESAVKADITTVKADIKLLANDVASFIWTRRIIVGAIIAVFTRSIYSYSPFTFGVAPTSSDIKTNVNQPASDKSEPVFNSLDPFCNEEMLAVLTP
uniref:Phosphoinositide phospholipase C n=1 Tax=Meloidogyne hapla TaxID=6305 RepID=A0A1I8AYT0_MELHA